ncbi:MAG: hypothetical protein VB122_03910 [Erysipelotrichales bacterium]|nr:hypothetical protein [Erysipelotrichales bacterium]
MYRAKLCFKDNYLLAKVVQTGEYSVKIKGDGILFNVFVYNVQLNIELDYASRNNHNINFTN